MDPRQSVEFEPVQLGRRRRRSDPVRLGVAVVVVALVLAVVKPWDGSGGLAAASPVASLGAIDPSPSGSPTPASPTPPEGPSWADLSPAISRQTTWGIRAIVDNTRTTESSGTFSEWWVPIDGATNPAASLDERDGLIAALGVTFPPSETPLDVRIWRAHTGGEFEWVDARPVDDVPARGAYLYLRPVEGGARPTTWEPGQYRVDVLVSGAIRRMSVLIGDRVGRVPDLEPLLVPDPDADPIGLGSLADIPTGLFLQTDTEVVPLPVTSGRPLDESGSWLDVDPSAAPDAGLSRVARIYEPRTLLVGVVLPAYSTVKAASVKRIAPSAETAPTIRWSNIGSLMAVSYVAFGLAPGIEWKPGVYAIGVSWNDASGPNLATWYLELRPGPLSPPPRLLAATRQWASFAGGHGVLLGVSEPPTAADPVGLRLVDIAPQTHLGYPGMTGEDLVGCGPTHVQGRPEVIGIVGSPTQALAPVSTRILYPFSDQGPLDVLTASGWVPGLTLIAPVVTAEFGGPASYGMRAGTGRDAPGYTICVGLPGG